MGLGESQAILRGMESVYRGGSVTGLTDAELMRRVIERPDDRGACAFEAIVVRHGPMVLAVCRSLLQDRHLADDAFQTTFLILARKAKTIWVHDSLAGWLSGVAYKVATRARGQQSRHVAVDQAAVLVASGEDPDLPETRRVVVEEVERLPARFRMPILLCYFEGQTHDQAALVLRVPVGTVRSRLARAREQLKGRLVRRGLAPAVGLMGKALETRAAMPTNLLQNTVKAASALLSTGSIPAGMITVSVSTLVQGVLDMMLLTKLKTAGLALSAFACLGVGGAVLAHQKTKEVTKAATTNGVASDKTEFDAVQLALKEAIPAAIPSSDPYLTTFALIRLAKAQNALGDRAAALDTFVKADEMAAKVSDQFYRRLAIMRTAVARARIGDSAPAHATLEGFVVEGSKLSGSDRYKLMVMVINSLYQAGFKDEARARLAKELAVVDATEDEISRNMGINNLISNQLTLGDFDDALDRAARYVGKKSEWRAAILRVIVTFVGETGERPSKEIALRALELARGITEPLPRGWVQLEIVAALAHVGAIDSAMASLDELGKGEPDMVQLRGSLLPLALVEIAREQTKSGANAAAIESLHKAFLAAQDLPSRDGIYAARVRMIAIIQGIIGDVEGANASVAAIKNDSVEKASALVALARAQTKVGDRAAAIATLHEAINYSKDSQVRANLGDPADKNPDSLRHGIALAQAEAGDSKGAIATVASRGSDAWKSETLAEIALIQARLGDVTGALATAKSIIDPTRSGEAYSSIASLQAKAGAPASALAWASKLESPTAKAFALIGITDGMATRKREREVAKP